MWIADCGLRNVDCGLRNVLIINSLRYGKGGRMERIYFVIPKESARFEIPSE
jgi:hypothetical protein